MRASASDFSANGMAGLHSGFASYLCSRLELKRPRESEIDAPLWRHSYTLPRVRAALYSHSRFWPHQIYSAAISIT